MAYLKTLSTNGRELSAQPQALGVGAGDSRSGQCRPCGLLLPPVDWPGSLTTSPSPTIPLPSMRLFRKTALSFIAVAALAGCRDGTAPKTSSRDTATVLIPDETKVLSATAAAALGSVSDSRLAFAASSADAGSLAAGDIIVAGVTATTPDGILRKVTARQVRADSIIITTVPARLTEAIERGSGSVDVPLEIDDPAGQASPGITFSRSTQTVGAASAGGFTVTFVDYDIKGYAKVSGTMTLNPALKLDTKFDGFALESFTYTVTATTTSKLELKSVASGKLEGSYPIKTVRMRPVTFFVGVPPLAIPIVVVPTAELRLSGSGDISAGIETSVSSAYTVSQGATYKGGAWTPIGESTPTFTFTAPRPKLNASARVSFGPKFILALYAPSVFEAYADLNGFVKAEVTMLQDPFWKLSGGIESSIGLTSSLFDTKFVNLNRVSVLSKEVLLASGYKVTITPEKNDTATKTVAQSFTASMTAPPKQARYTWTFNDGTAVVTKLNDASVSHAFPAQGQFQISVKVEDVEKDYEAAFDTAVVKVRGLPVATVSVTPATSQITKGGSTTLSATLKDAAGGVLTDRVVRWSSSAPAVATVDSVTGVVTGVAQGTATITARSESKTGTATVTVTEVMLYEIELLAYDNTDANRQVIKTLKGGDALTIYNSAMYDIRMKLNGSYVNVSGLNLPYTRYSFTTAPFAATDANIPSYAMTVKDLTNNRNVTLTLNLTVNNEAYRRIVGKTLVVSSTNTGSYELHFGTDLNYTAILVPAPGKTYSFGNGLTPYIEFCGTTKFSGALIGYVNGISSGGQLVPQDFIMIFEDGTYRLNGSASCPGGYTVTAK